MNDTMILKPENAQQLQETIAWLVSERMAVSLCGLNSKQAIGCSPQPDSVLDLSAFNGIELYEPEELVLSAGAATPMSDIHKALDDANQMLAFEPPNYAPLLGLPEDQSGSLGGLIATNLAGPRRLKAGAARDHFLGFEAVSGRGEAFKSGGRVVKNVTGYDLPKLLCGSWGTLGAMHQVTVKTLPRAEKSRTVLIQDVDAATGREIMSQALNSPYEVSGACWLTASTLSASSLGILDHFKGSAVAVRVEGPGPSVEYRCQVLRDQFKSHGKAEELHTKNTATFWREIRDVLPFAQKGDDRVVWKISVAPTDGPSLIEKLKDLKGVDSFMDWGGGLIWMAVDAPKLGAEGLIRQEVNALGGHATMIRAPLNLREDYPVFHPEPKPLAQLTKRLKENFDPHGLLNPGRMYQGV